MAYMHIISHSIVPVIDIDNVLRAAEANPSRTTLATKHRRSIWLCVHHLMTTFDFGLVTGGRQGETPS
jgi:hypothetical protein